MPRALKNPYGIRDGIVVTADMVQRGLACGCLCPGCGERLIANHGESKQEYFSHESEATDCETAYETALHLLAKEVLAAEMRLILPPLCVTVDRQLIEDVKHSVQTLKMRYVNIPAEISDLDLDRDIPSVEHVRAGHYQTFEQVDTEVVLGEIIPDVVMFVAGRKLLVEIFVTHPVTDAKRHWLEENGLPMIEFDFSAANRTIGRNDLNRAFLQPQRSPGDGRSRWIHHPRAKQDQHRLDAEFRANYLDRIHELVQASDPAQWATCDHEPVPTLGEDGVHRSLCRKCWKFFGRISGTK